MAKPTRRTNKPVESQPTPIASTPHPQRTSERSCLVCRNTRKGDQLLQLALSNGELTLGKSSKGSGAYVCAQRACLEGLSPKAFQRSFKVEQEQLSGLIDRAHLVAKKRVLECIGLARRLGILDVGVDAIIASPWRTVGSDSEANRDYFMIASPDLAERSLRRLETLAERAGGKLNKFISAAEQGHAAGMAILGAAGIRPGQLALQAAYWLQVWYETAQQHPQGATTTQLETD